MSEVKLTSAAATAPAAPLLQPIFADVGAGRTFTMLGTTMRLITAADAGGLYTVLEQVTPPGWRPPRHIHSREDEIFYILEGAYELHVGDERRKVFAGASVRWRNVRRRRIPHNSSN